MKVWIDKLNFGQALTSIQTMNKETGLDVFGMRLPKWNLDKVIKISSLIEGQPHLKERDIYGELIWSPSQSELFDNTWEVVEVEE